MERIYKILIGMLLLLTAVGCEQEYLAPNEFSDVAWYTNKQNTGDFKLKVGQHMSFMDLSQNALTHSWSIEDGNNYLMNGFDNDDVLAEFIDPNKGLVADDLTVHVLFNNQGLNKVKLYNTFNSPVTFMGEEPFEAKEENGVWVIDTSFIVDVYGPLLPAYEVYKIIDDTLGNIISEELILAISEDETPMIKDSADWDVVTLEAGSRIKLVDLTLQDRPNAREWQINNQEPASIYTDSVAMVYFNRLGHTSMMGLLNAQRKQAVGDDTPTASAKKIIPLKVEVIKSSKPFIAIGGFKEVDGLEAVSFTVAGEVDSIINAEGAFTVHVTNAVTGYDEEIAVAEVRKNAKDASKVELLLADTIYGNDVVTVSFDNSLGTLTSVDGRVLSSFAAQTVEMAMKGENIMIGSDGELLRWVGYEEDANENPKNGYMKADEGTGAWWAGAPAFYKSDEMYFTGGASLKFAGDATAENNLWHMNVTDAVEFPAGSYIIRQKIFIRNGSDVQTLTTEMSDKSAGWEIVMDLNWDLTNVARDKWVELEMNTTLASSLVKASGARWGYYVKPSLNPGISASQTFYLDDLEIIPIESRP